MSHYLFTSESVSEGHPDKVGSDPKVVERIKKSDFCFYKKAEIWMIHLRVYCPFYCQMGY